jgi:hypothetical protein
MIKIHATFLNLLKHLGREPEKMKWGYTFGYLAATDITENEEKQMRDIAKWFKQERMVPITGCVVENKKGAYFVPDTDGMIMKIDCKIPHRKLSKKESQFTLKPAYRNIV